MTRPPERRRVLGFGGTPRRLPGAVAERIFRDRRHAGRVLAGLLAHYRGVEGVVVLGVPRGGVPVADVVAEHLGAPLDVFIVRKLGVPGRPEVAMGAIASGDVLVVNEDVVRRLGIPSAALREVAEQEGRERRRREAAYRGARPMTGLEGLTVILVDDGMATGASMRAAVRALRKHRPDRVVVAVPLAPAPAREELEREVDEMVCAATLAVQCRRRVVRGLRPDGGRGGAPAARGVHPQPAPPLHTRSRRPLTPRVAATPPSGGHG